MYSPLLLFSSLLPSALQCYCDRCTANSSCTTDGVCFVALRRSGSQLIGEHRQCINENELIPRDRPFICAPSMREDLGIYPMCCTTDYCNKVADPELAHGKHTRTRARAQFVQVFHRLNFLKVYEFVCELNELHLKME